MKYLLGIIFVIVGYHFSFGQDSISVKLTDRKNALYVELAGRGYFSLNYDRAWGNKNRVSFGFGWNDMETNLDSLEAIEMGVDGDHEASPYLLFNAQYSRLIGKGPHYLELGAGVVVTLFDLERFEFANNLYINQPYISIYPLVGYRYEGIKGLLFMASFNPLIDIPQGTFWPFPGVSLGYRF
jgi:hypothetical protein